jgi:hypothetical protein
MRTERPPQALLGWCSDRHDFKNNPGQHVDASVACRIEQFNNALNGFLRSKGLLQAI